MAANSHTLGSLQPRHAYSGAQLSRSARFWTNTPTRQAIISTSDKASGARQESRTEFLVRALALEAARVLCDLGPGAVEFDIVRLFAGEELGLSPQQLQALGMGTGLPEVKRVKRRRASIGSKSKR